MKMELRISENERYGHLSSAVHRSFDYDCVGKHPLKRLVSLGEDEREISKCRYGPRPFLPYRVVESSLCQMRDEDATFSGKERRKTNRT